MDEKQIRQLIAEAVYHEHMSRNAKNISEFDRYSLQSQAKQQAIISYVASLETELEALKAKDSQANLLDLLDLAAQKTHALERQMAASAEAYALKLLTDERLLHLSDYEALIAKQQLQIERYQALLSQHNISHEELNNA